MSSPTPPANGSGTGTGSGTDTTAGPFTEVQRDPDICGNCFRRIYERYERNYRLEPYYDRDQRAYDVRPVNVQGVQLTIGNDTAEVGGMDDEVYRTANTTKIPEDGGHRGLRTVCSCGFRYSSDMDEWKERPLPKRQFFEYAYNLLDRYYERGITLDPDVFVSVLQQRKSDPDAQFADDRIFADATEAAIQAMNGPIDTDVRADADHDHDADPTITLDPIAELQTADRLRSDATPSPTDDHAATTAASATSTPHTEHPTDD